MKYTATILVTTQITQEIEVDLPDDVDFNPVLWDEWENALEDAGIKPTVKRSEVITASTNVIQFGLSREGRTA